MSGTSVDGIDAALIEIRSTSDIRVIETQFTPFTNSLRSSINKVAQTNSELNNCEDSPLHTELANHYANASLSLIKKAGVSRSQIKAIANHGQTVKHTPNTIPPLSLQLGDPQSIADLTRITTVGHFRQADLMAGGQGAPIMPAFHQTILSSDKSKKRYVLNIGGIANITQLGDAVIGFDTGPGNTLLDQWITQHQNKKYDHDGQWAKSGTLIPKMLEALLNDPYFSQPFPKSTGPDYFNLNWLHNRYQNAEKHKPEDVQATLLSLTVTSIAQCIKSITSENETSEVYICGGGAHNTFMLNELQALIPHISIDTTESIGIPADWVEAVGFAWLGYCALHNITSNLPSVTGAKEKVVLGELFTPR